MMKDHARLMKAFSALGEIVGRKKLQKIIFIAKKHNYAFHEKYQFHFFGPYSEELTLRVEELCNMGFIKEFNEKKSGYYQYRYEVTEEGQAFLEAQNELAAENLTPFLKNLNEQSSRFLELVSTLLYFDTLEMDARIEKVQKVKAKQNYMDEEIAEALAYIEQLNQLV
ncbi:YwgA family protein [Jeotgalibacillus sp. R-1-5s-1]|uniref:YwgA family protein n=1 Tax=Jeotgalibacillus sp. R-1-5s-1 TaxID=2555897 RepID=UPI00106D441E|nr:YwgA family protein [Jeotgalibacillus sp. R-1-5s-1]TFD92896.1 YwgA family protein [Jeotgalibacillus sp. R-1-5s-1]